MAVSFALTSVDKFAEFLNHVETMAVMKKEETISLQTQF